ncbi:MAG: sugar phosphate isomerase/epimerase [Lentisphaerae bacterium]|nr:sugar phosphate isomerase/epimerase [Lentisphaerota bacterium]
MIKFGVNSVLYQGHDIETAFKHISWAGYDGIELSAIQGMCEHLDLDNWQAQVDPIKKLSEEYNLALLSMEVASLDRNRLTKAFQAGQAIGIPVVNIGPGGKKDIEEDFIAQTDKMVEAAKIAEDFGMTLCCKAHVGASIYSTPTTLRAMEKIDSPAFGIDMDPSHIFRANENPEEALPAVISRVRHIHIRDCKGRGPSPGEPRDQACGRGDIDLPGYVKAMLDADYNGPVNLEIIGAGNYEMPKRDIIAAESIGYIKACLRMLTEG